MSRDTAIKAMTAEVVLHGRQNNQCWFAPGLAVVPPKGPGARPEVFIGVSQLVGNDMGTPHWIGTSDLGAHWSPPMESQNLLGNPRENHWFEKLGVSLFYHRRTQRLLGLGSTHFSRDEGTHLQFKMEKIDSERVVFPEKGARMGNFDVANVTLDEAWVVTGEWIEGKVEGMHDGDRFHVPNRTDINRIQFVGDLLLARIRF